MKCPRCLDHPLHPVTLEGSLQAETCDRCEGYWLGGEKYDRWREDKEETWLEKEPQVTLEVDDSEQVKLCPHCVRILIKYRVGHGTDFVIERCGNCNGVWFDKNEWETLKNQNLHDEIHQIFSQSWQTAIRRQENAEKLDQLYYQKFGRRDYEEIQKIWAWLKTRPQRQALLAYLNDENPYQV